ncbi:hypothetical protein MBLNU230_g0563t1 [Neophaeotheca triangularis]
MASPPKFPTTPQTRLTGHKAAIHALSWSAKDATYLLTGSEDRTIRLWRPSSRASQQNRQHISTLTPGYPVLDLAINGTNDTIACVGDDRSVTLWDVRSEECLRRLQVFTKGVNSVTFAAEGDGVVLAGGLDGRVLGFDRANAGKWTPVLEWREARDSVLCVVVPEGGREVFVGSADGCVRIYDVGTGEVSVDVVAGERSVGVCCVVPAGDGESYLVVTLDSTVRVMDRRTGECLRTFTHPEFVVKNYRIRAALAVGDRVAVCGSEEGSVFFWEVETGELLGRVKHWQEGGNPKRKAVSAVAWNAVTGQWASAGMDGEVVVWG